jgi:hypothetical protein
MERNEILRQIAELERQVNAELAQTRLPGMRSSHKAFPSPMWGLTAFCFGWGAFGGQIPPAERIHAMSMPYAYYVGVVLGGIAVLQTVLWLFSRGSTADASYIQHTHHVRELQQQLAALRQQLRDLDTQ